DKQRIKLNTKDVQRFMLIMKRWNEEEKTIKKGLLEAWIDLGFRICNNAYPEPDSPEMPFIKKSMFPIFLNFVREIAEMLQYISNSYSWRHGEETSFDKQEIQNKIKRALSLL
ncbi:MAG: hypothetical protein ACFFG0_24490, partial [Candidatus Thorarchaeota archaeon]